MARRKFNAVEKASALAVIQTTNVRKASRLLGIPRSTIKGWARGQGVSEVSEELIAEKKSELAAKFEEIANKLTNAMLDDGKIEKANLSQIAVACGIAVDKANILRNMPTRITKAITESSTERRRYEVAINQLIEESKKKDYTVTREEAIDLLEPHLPNIRGVLTVPEDVTVH